MHAETRRVFDKLRVNNSVPIKSFRRKNGVNGKNQQADEQSPALSRVVIAQFDNIAHLQAIDLFERALYHQLFDNRSIFKGRGRAGKTGLDSTGFPPANFFSQFLKEVLTGIFICDTLVDIKSIMMEIVQLKIS
jgi:hypothetical protein